MKAVCSAITCELVVAPAACGREGGWVTPCPGPLDNRVSSLSFQKNQWTPGVLGPQAKPLRTQEVFPPDQTVVISQAHPAPGATSSVPDAWTSQEHPSWLPKASLWGTQSRQVCVQPTLSCKFKIIPRYHVRHTVGIQVLLGR